MSSKRLWLFALLVGFGGAMGGCQLEVLGTQGETSNESDSLADGGDASTASWSPVITAVSPASGSPAGGTSITLTGNDFSSGASVTIGGSTCASVTVSSTTSITCMTPSGAPGAKDIIVTNSNAKSATLAGGYTYLNWASLTITGTVNFGYRARGTTAETTLTVTNSGGVAATSMQEDGTQALAAPFDFKAGSYPGTGGSCGASLAAGASCSLVVEFSSSNASTAAYADTLAISYDNGSTSSTATASLAGTSQASWNATTSSGLSARYLSASVWTGSKFIVWGGRDADGNNRFADGKLYDPVTDTWTAMSSTDAPAARSDHTLIWASNAATPVAIVYGGAGNGGTALSSGAMYNPANDTWVATNTTGVAGTDYPRARYGHVAVWDQVHKKMLVFGGGATTQQSDAGWAFDPDTNSWTALESNNAPTARFVPTGAWTGSKLIVWGGCVDKAAGVACNAGGWTNSGGIYDPAAAAGSRWTPISTTNGDGAPAARWKMTSVWTGSRFIVWGGEDAAATTLNTGGMYDPGIDSWTSTSIGAGVPTARDRPISFWTGNRMLVWGGLFASGNGALFDPTSGANGAWTATSTTNSPTRTYGVTGARSDTDGRIFVFGGLGSGSVYSSDPAIYVPE